MKKVTSQQINNWLTKRVESVSGGKYNKSQEGYYPYASGVMESTLQTILNDPKAMKQFRKELAEPVPLATCPTCGDGHPMCCCAQDGNGG